MTFDAFLSLAAFAFVTSITPGPNNLMLMASGANFGLRRTVPHMLGVALGFVAMVIIVGVGLAQLFSTVPALYAVLKVLSIGYLLYLAWRIATADGMGSADRTGRPMTFIEAALFQWVNPKAWTMALASIALYAPSQSLAAIVLVAVIFGAINLPSVSSWTVLGQQMKRFLTTGRRLRIFNWTMAVLLVLSLIPSLQSPPV
jgi:threonine/homoserine/homoserine lactone efflux protein